MPATCMDVTTGNFSPQLFEHLSEEMRRDERERETYTRD